jgi:hypothetical protein
MSTKKEFEKNLNKYLLRGCSALPGALKSACRL